MDGDKREAGYCLLVGLSGAELSITKLAYELSMVSSC